MLYWIQGHREKTILFQVIKDIFIMIEEVHTLNGLVTNSYVIKDQPIDQSILHPPQQLRLILHHSAGCDADILQIILCN